MTPQSLKGLESRLLHFLEDLLEPMGRLSRRVPLSFIEISFPGTHASGFAAYHDNIGKGRVHLVRKASIA